MERPYCVCDLCQRRWRLRNAVAMCEWRPLAVIAEGLLDELEHIEMDRQVLQLQLAGRWPGYEPADALQTPDWISQ